LRDSDGQPTATCSVAAPLADASLARAECERLMRIDRWGRLDALTIRQELLDEWGLTIADGSSGPPLDRDDRVAAALAERDEALATTAQLKEELLMESEQRDSLRAESERAAARAEELDGAVAAEKERCGELERSLGRSDARVTELEAEISAVRAEHEEHVLRAQTLEAAAASAPEAHGPRWDAGSQRALSAALVGLTEWQAVLKHAVVTLGAEGGWDVAVAWCPDVQRGSMRCGAIWTRDSAGLAKLEKRTWQHRQDALTAEFGRRGGGGYGVRATRADQLRRRDDRDGRAALPDWDRAECGAHGFARSGCSPTRRRRAALQARRRASLADGTRLASATAFSRLTPRRGDRASVPIVDLSAPML
jgi:hypothetical protein